MQIACHDKTVLSEVFSTNVVVQLCNPHVVFGQEDKDEHLGTTVKRPA